MGEPRRLIAIEASRGVAATAVVLYHVARHLNFVYGLPSFMSVFQFGHAGVDLFFAISGFIILFVHYDDINHPERVPHYIWRRFSRIMPIYWIALSVPVILSLLGGHGFPSLSQFIWSATLLPSYHWPLLSVAWTLQFEMTFYIIFCLLVANKKIGVLAISLWLAWIILSNLDTRFAGGMPGSLYELYNFEFFFGMAAAYWFKNNALRRLKSMLAFGMVLFAVAALAEDAHLMNGYAPLSRLVYGPVAALIVLGAAECSRSGRVAVPKIFKILGAASYSIHLFQFVFIGVLWKIWNFSGLGTNMPHLVSFPFLAAVAIAGGVAVSRIIEYPLMQMMRYARPSASVMADAR